MGPLPAGVTTAVARHRHQRTSGSQPSAAAERTPVRSGMTAPLSAGVTTLMARRRRRRTNGSYRSAAACISPAHCGLTGVLTAGEKVSSRKSGRRSETSSSFPSVAAGSMRAPCALTAALPAGGLTEQIGHPLRRANGSPSSAVAVPTRVVCGRTGAWSAGGVTKPTRHPLRKANGSPPSAVAVSTRVVCGRMGALSAGGHRTYASTSVRQQRRRMSGSPSVRSMQSPHWCRLRHPHPPLRLSRRCLPSCKGSQPPSVAGHFSRVRCARTAALSVGERTASGLFSHPKGSGSCPLAAALSKRVGCGRMAAPPVGEIEGAGCRHPRESVSWRSPAARTTRAGCVPITVSSVGVRTDPARLRRRRTSSSHRSVAASI